MSNHDAEKTSKYLMYLDGNNFYGWAMMQYLPYGGFRWLREKQIEKLVKKDNIAEDNKKGYILEVDLSILQSFIIYIMTIPVHQKR